MELTTHYYVLVLGERTSRLYEAFPIESSAVWPGPVDPAPVNGRLLEFIRTADQHFDHYFKQDPLRLVVVGEKNHLSIFNSVTTHRDVLLGSVEGDYAATSPHDLGRIVWLIVKMVMAGTNGRAMHDLEAAESSQSMA